MDVFEEALNLRTFSVGDDESDESDERGKVSFELDTECESRLSDNSEKLV